jgi:hypothetical protein
VRGLLQALLELGEQMGSVPVAAFRAEQPHELDDHTACATLGAADVAALGAAAEAGAEVRAGAGAGAGTGAGGLQMDFDPCCSICLLQYEAGDTVRRLRCGHAFHLTCVDLWLSAHPACPVCKLHAIPAPPE